MDYEGQKLSELIFYWLILVLSGVGWIIGYIRQEFFIVFKFWLVSVVISIVVSVAYLEFYSARYRFAGHQVIFRPGVLTVWPDVGSIRRRQ